MGKKSVLWREPVVAVPLLLHCDGGETIEVEIRVAGVFRTSRRKYQSLLPYAFDMALAGYRRLQICKLIVIDKTITGSLASGETSSAPHDRQPKLRAAKNTALTSKYGVEHKYRVCPCRELIDQVSSGHKDSCASR